jgi:hypothetical protein
MDSHELCWKGCINLLIIVNVPVLLGEDPRVCGNVCTSFDGICKISQNISFPSPPSAGNSMDERHTDVGGTGH